MTTLPGPAQPAELDTVVGLITAQQVRPERSIVYLGSTARGIREELDALTPAWQDTLRVARDGSTIVGVSIVEWDPEVNRAWILGPWIDGDDTAWSDLAGPLLDAALAQLPEGMLDVEVAGHVAHTRLAYLAASRGWSTGPVNHALTIRHAIPEPSAQAGAATIRDATGDDLVAINPLHESEFPATHSSVAQLVRGDDTVVVVATANSGIVGYAAGQLHADGEGYIDYLAVQPTARGSGVGRLLVSTLTNRLLSASRAGQVSLTVEHERTRARALYRSLGFEPDGSFVAHRSRTHRPASDGNVGGW